jgi:hypothetical protein
MEDLGFLEILFRGARGLLGIGSRVKNRFERGQNIVATVIVVGIIVSMLFWILLSMP